MRVVWVVGAIGLSIGVAMARPAAIWDTYRQLYPADPAERRALNECFTQDPSFNRLDQAARQACYRHSLATMPNSAQARVAMPQGNFVDLWRAAGQGRLPQNDVRAEEQTDRLFHAAPISQTR